MLRKVLIFLFSLANFLFSNNYQHESNYNRLNNTTDIYEINNLNQLLETDDASFVYDKNGNLIKQITEDYTINYFYDSLDRLLKVEKENDYVLEFSYDPFNRRISKSTKYSSCLQSDEHRYFLYDDQNEIGSFDHNLNQKELRILSDIETAEIGSAIAFEIADYAYAPIYDISGNAVSLIYNKSLYEHYRYSAFGEHKIYSSWGYEKQKSQINNPWQFSSKRIDIDSGLVYFGRRYYDPSFGRWLTCDPLGFEDGMNLYSYVMNDPLTNVDLYGLYANPWMFPQSTYATLDFS